jgi:hypothetical protein
MRPDDLHEFTRKRPFSPFRIHTTDGRVYEIMHPDQAIPLRSRVVIGVGGDDNTPDRTEHIALIHIVRLEELDGPTRQAG